MSRKPIPESTQTAILLKSRRRCCLCFWLKGEDEVKKGQFAHLDHDHENPAESNLAFMCFEHHDEYDSTTRLSKGLREPEVKKWRDELYKEMLYRFKTIKQHGFELSIVRFLPLNPVDRFHAEFRLKNSGEVAVRSPVVAIQLPANVGGELPKREQFIGRGGPYGVQMSMPVVELWRTTEERLDLFEPNGRVAIKSMGGVNPVIMPGHTFEFDALVFSFKDYPEGATVELNYRVDAEAVSTVTGALTATVPSLNQMALSMHQR
ncbi:hypothetical protein J0H58_23875 [bacterium]|nr:hypothetical protein [bacterium]